jgi:PAS domain S-box-containing protein
MDKILATHSRKDLLEKAVLRIKRLEKELAELRQRETEYRQLVHAANDGIYLLYNRKFEIINKKFAEMFGVTLEYVNHPDFDFIELVAPKSRPLIEERQRKIEGGEKVDSKYEFTALSRDGRELEVEVSVSSVKYKDGMAVQGVVRDISERKYLERQIRHSQKIEAISRLAGGIAHDFNNILAIIRGYTELSLDDVPGGSILSRNLHHVLAASDRARDLVNQILAFSRQSDEEHQPVRLSRIIEESLRILRPSLPSAIKIHHHIDNRDGIVIVEPTRIRQVMINLYANSIHAMRETGGVLEVRLEKVKLGTGDINGLKDLAAGFYLKLSVKDTGHGMSPDVLERIFDPYFTTKCAGEGSGMGLSVIHGIVKKHGGEIVVESERGKGTAFYLYFPLVEGAPEEESAGAEPIPGVKERILLVDDEQVLVYMEQEVLERLGYDVVAISNSIEALEIFKSDPELFDLVIADQGMHGMTGIRLSVELLKIRPGIPIILCTDFNDSLTRQQALKTGVKEFLMKPIIKREIAAVIRKLLNHERTTVNKYEKEE